MKFEDNKPLYQAPATRSQLKHAAHSGIAIGICSLVWGLSQFVNQERVFSTGKGRAIDLLAVAVVGEKYAYVVDSGFFILLGFGLIYFGMKKGQESKNSKLP